MFLTRPVSRVRVLGLLAASFVLCRTRAAETATTNTALNPLQRPEMPWHERHQQFAERAHRGDFNLLFLGDSLMDFWRTRGKTAWNRCLAPLESVNFGASGDHIQNLLWRLQNGELDGAHPKLVVLLIGMNNLRTNDYWCCTPPQVAEGITAVVTEIHQRCPQSRVLVLGLFPEGQKPDEPGRARVKEVNQLLAKLDDGKMTRVLDLGPKFLEPDGTLPDTIMPDFRHPNEKGYQIWADAMLPVIKEMLQNP